MVLIAATISYLFIMLSSEAWSMVLPKPRRVKIESLMISWRGSAGDVYYTAQYQMSKDEAWQNLPGCIKTQLTSCNFTATIKEYYGATFRVRSEKGNHTSAWEESEQVQCVHTHSCVPQVKLTAKAGMLIVQMSDQDNSLKNEEHVRYRIYYSEAERDLKEYAVVDSNMETIKDLREGQKYCVKVQYVIYHRNYSSASPLKCEVPTESAEKREVRMMLLGGLVPAFILAMCGVCLFAFYKNYERIKQWLRPPIDLPEHLQEFLSSDFHPMLHSPGSESVLLSDTLIVDLEEISTDAEEDDMESGTS